MTTIQKLRGTQLLIKIGDGASPENFTHRCLINTKRGVKFASTTNKIIVPDCDNPDDPAWAEAVKDALTCTIDGAGTLDAAAVPEMDAWLRSPDSKNIQAWLGTLGYWQAGFHLTNFEITGDRGALIEVALTCESDGIVPPYVPQP